MPRNNVTDLITDQEMAFARLVLSGTMTDRDAAQAAGLKPDAAAYTKAKPRVRDYMLEHRAAVQQKFVEQEAEALRRRDLGRERVLGRLWEIADKSSEMTRGSFTNQIKAISLIVAIEGLIPDRRASSPSASSPQRASENQSTPPPAHAQIYQAAWLREQQEKANHPEPGPASAQEEEEPGPDEPEPELEPAVDPSESDFANRVSSSETTPDIRAPLWMRMNPFGPHR